MSQVAIERLRSDWSSFDLSFQVRVTVESTFISLLQRGGPISVDEYDSLRTDDIEGDIFFALAKLVFDDAVVELFETPRLRLGITTLPHLVHRAAIMLGVPGWWRTYLDHAFKAIDSPSDKRSFS